ncbi:MAG TPA: hypothetical protein PLM75_09310 [bacterium]|nr:hypothetical protein [bacterium]
MIKLLTRIIYFSLFFGALLKSFQYSAETLNINFTTIHLLVFLFSFMIIVNTIKFSLYFIMQIEENKINDILYFMCLPFFTLYFQPQIHQYFKNYFKFDSSAIKYHFYFVIFTALLILFGNLLLIIYKNREKLNNSKSADKIYKYYLLLFLILIYGFLMITSQIHGIHGDEINHIWLADSLKNDFDVNLINNTPQNQYFLIAHYFFKNNNSQVYTSVMPGTALFSMPLYFLLKTLGIRIFIFICSIILAVFLYNYLIYKNIKPFFAFIAILVSLSLHPINVYSSQIYPELIAALLSLLTIIFFEKAKPIFSALFCALLIYFHIKYIALIGLLIAIILFFYRSTPQKNKFVFLIFLAIFSIPFELYIFNIYNSFNPFSPYIFGSDSAPYSFFQLLKLNVLSNNFFKQLYLNLFDLQFGLFINNPLYLFIFFAIITISLKNPKKYGHFLILIFGYTFYLFLNNQNYNGYSPFNRLLTPILPFSAVFFAEYLQSLTNKKIKILLIAGFIISFTISSIFILLPISRYPNFYGYNSIYNLIRNKK